MYTVKYLQKNSIILFMTVIMLLSTIACSDDKDSKSPAEHIEDSESLTIPPEVAVPNGATRVATYFAKGVQKYRAQQVAGTSNFEWIFVAPQADLYDETNTKVGTHSAGPTWQLTAADSIYGQAYNPAKTAQSPDANSIAWLLLKPKDGTTPKGAFNGVLYIQRIATDGGKAPAEAPTSASQTVDVDYTAIYRFSK